MADTFIDVPITTDAATLSDNAIDQLRATWDGWEPNEGDQEVVQIETIAPMAADAATAASRMPSAAFRAIVQNLHGVPYIAGQPATATVTFTLTDTDPHKVKAGDAIDIDGHEFKVDSDVTNATGSLTIPAVAVTASTVGADANDLAGDSVVPITALSFVSDVTLDTTTGGGADPETDGDFQDRGSRELELQAKTLVIGRDYELMALSQPGIARATARTNAADRTVDVTVTDDAGLAVPSTVKDALAATYDTLRLSNWSVSIEDATYTPVSVTYSVRPYPSVDPTDLIARVDAMLNSWLSSSGFGVQKSTSDAGTTGSTWIADNVVRRNKLIDLIGDVPGVDYVDTLAITGAGGGGDLTLPGTIALPTPGSFTGSTV